jgi:type VII secretion integral membrane protein EccD
VAASSTETGLAKVIVAAPRRRLEVALPEHLPVMSLLPTLLRQGSDELAGDGLNAGGWVLRRADGTQVDGARSLAAQSIRDGEVLHLQPRYVEWPELEYDDIVDAIAAGARQGGPPWTRSATRLCGLAVTALTLLLIPVTVLMTGGRWIWPATAALVLSVLLAVSGIVLSRALADSVAGAVLGALALPNGLLGGLLVLADSLPLREFGAPQVLMASTTVLLLAVVGYVGVADLKRLFVAGIVSGTAGVLGAGLALTSMHAAAAAAVVVTVFLVFSPAFPLLSVRLAKVPLPAVPRDAEDLRAADTFPSLAQTMAQVAHSTELLAGALLGTGIVAAIGAAMLAAAGQLSTLLLAGVVSGAFLLRARMLVAIRQRLALLAGGVAGMVAVVFGTTVAVPAWARFAVVLPALIVVAVLVCAAALTYSRRAPSPYLGRWADVGDVVLTLAAGPIAAAVLGLYQVMRGLAG